MSRADRNASRREALTQPLSASSRGSADLALPWALDATDSDTIRNADGLAIAGACINGRDRSARRNTTASIVLAVNHHDKLVSALRDMVRKCTPDPIPLDGGKIYGVRCPDRATVDDARAILAEVEKS